MISDEDDALLRKVFRMARKDPTVVRCGNVWVDVPGAIERRVACSDGLCWKSAGKSLTGKSCCSTFRVPIERKEVRRIEKVLTEVRTIRDVGAAIDRAGGFWHDEDGTPWLNTRPDESCVFLSAPPGGMPLCTLHEWAASRGIDHRKVKPETCCLFPLYVAMCDDDALVTSYGSRWYCELEPDERDDIKTFACTKPPKGGGVPLVTEQRAELEHQLGKRRWAAALEKLRALGHEV
jgi:hypothetical protein